VSNIRRVFVGTSGWSLARGVAPGSKPGASGLERYAEYFNSVEVNSTFYRLPRPQTVQRWRDSTPDGFRFAVKVPRSLTHEARLVDVDAQIVELCELFSGFGSKLGALLVQLPPSLQFEREVVAPFLEQFARAAPAAVVLEPRHVSWFRDDVDQLLIDHRVARVAADPACCPAAARPGACPDIVYYRWHGSPRKYFSAYTPEAIASLASQLLDARQTLGARREIYCFMDNTGLGAAAVNALSLNTELTGR
jgi:uncharacterized protein YecE (DUF72 family)